MLRVPWPAFLGRKKSGLGRNGFQLRLHFNTSYTYGGQLGSGGGQPTMCTLLKKSKELSENMLSVRGYLGRH